MNDNGGKNLLEAIRKWWNYPPAVIFSCINYHKMYWKKIGFKNFRPTHLSIHLLTCLLAFGVIFSNNFEKKIHVKIYDNRVQLTQLFTSSALLVQIRTKDFMPL